jgi:hypothetical protein
MSILVSQNAASALSLSNYFASPLSGPISLAVQFKMPTNSTSGSYAFNLLEVARTDNTALTSLNIYFNGGADRGPQLNIVGPEFGGGDVLKGNIHPKLFTGWQTIVSTYAATTKTAYYKDTDTAVIPLSETQSFRTLTNLTDLKLLSSTNSRSAVYVARMAVYPGILTEAQAVEFASTGSVSAVAPIVFLDATSDWGAGTIVNSGSAGADITPPANWAYSADNPTIAATAPDYTQRKGSTFTATHTLGTITTATLNAVNVFDHVSSQAAGTVSFTGAITDERTTSGVVDLVLGDGAATQTQTVQVNVFGVVPSNNPAQKDGSALASLTGVQIRITAGVNLNGTEVYYSPTQTTDASGNFNTLDVSFSAAAAADPVRMQVLTAAGDSITSTEAVELI